VASLVCSQLVLKPLLARLGGRVFQQEMRQARLEAAMPANDLRQDYLRADVSRDANGTLTATPFKLQDSSMQRALTAAQGLIVRQPNAPEARVGDPVDLILIDF
jgi:molybdopterin molybdotransferase